MAFPHFRNTEYSLNGGDISAIVEDHYRWCLVGDGKLFCQVLPDTDTLLNILKPVVERLLQERFRIVIFIINLGNGVWVALVIGVLNGNSLYGFYADDMGGGWKSGVEEDNSPVATSYKKLCDGVNRFETDGGKRITFIDASKEKRYDHAASGLHAVACAANMTNAVVGGQVCFEVESKILNRELLPNIQLRNMYAESLERVKSLVDAGLAAPSLFY